MRFESIDPQHPHTETFIVAEASDPEITYATLCFFPCNIAAVPRHTGTSCKQVCLPTQITVLFGKFNLHAVMFARFLCRLKVPIRFEQHFFSFRLHVQKQNRLVPVEP